MWDLLDTLAEALLTEVVYFLSRLTGGHQRGFGIFVESVNKGSTAAKKGIKRGDQIIEVG